MISADTNRNRSRYLLTSSHPPCYVCQTKHHSSSPIHHGYPGGVGSAMVCLASFLRCQWPRRWWAKREWVTGRWEVRVCTAIGSYASGTNPQCTCHIKIQLGFSEGWIQQCIPATLHQEPDVDLEVPALRVVKRNYCNLADLASGSLISGDGCTSRTQSSELFCGLSMVMMGLLIR